MKDIFFYWDRISNQFDRPISTCAILNFTRIRMEDYDMTYITQVRPSSVLRFDSEKHTQKR